MAIEGRSLEEVAQEFRGILNSLLANTITKRPLQLTYLPGTAKDRFAVLAFRDHKGFADWETIPTRKVSRLRFYISHECGAERLGPHHYVLETVKYAYYFALPDEQEAFLRWEYVKRPGVESRWCRHHVQGPIDVSIGGRVFNLNDFHTPTGFVTVEEIVQFCINDLEAKAPDDWYDVVSRSYGRFVSDLRKRDDVGKAAKTSPSRPKRR